MKILNIVFACFIFIVAFVGSACKKDKDSQQTQHTLTVNAGSDRSIVWPRDSVTLTASAVSVGGVVASYHWVRKFGPSQGVIISPNAASTLVTGLVVGQYWFELTVTDSNGITSSDMILIIVYLDDPCFGCWDY